MITILTVKELSDYLKLSEKTILKMARNGDIPCTKIGHQWRFCTSIIDEWILKQMK